MPHFDIKILTILLGFISVFAQVFDAQVQRSVNPETMQIMQSNSLNCISGLEKNQNKTAAIIFTQYAI